jgi:hypothetical protein
MTFIFKRHIISRIFTNTVSQHLIPSEKNEWYSSTYTIYELSAIVASETQFSLGCATDFLDMYTNISNHVRFKTFTAHDL